MESGAELHSLVSQSGCHAASVVGKENALSGEQSCPPLTAFCTPPNQSSGLINQRCRGYHYLGTGAQIHGVAALHQDASGDRG